MDDVTRQSRIELLEEAITFLDTAFETGEDCICPVDIHLNNDSLTRSLIKRGEVVSDNEYDVMRCELEELNPNSEIFQNITASKIDSDVGRVVHDPPMCSIAKSNGTLSEKNNILAKWIKDCCDELGYKGQKDDKGQAFFVQSLKRDGVALALYYEEGKLVKAGLRPRDGVNGEDVTENAKYVDGIPENLSEPITCSIRGELECLKSTFEKLNTNAEEKGNQIYANPRNYTAGSIRQFKNPKETKNRKLSFTAYTIENLEDPPYQTEMERAIWCNKVLGVPFVQVREFKYSDLASIEEKAEDLDYEIDGVVLSVNNLEDQEQLGRHGNRATGNPKGKIAWKFAEKSATPIVKNIVWRTGRTGKVTPVLQFDAVKLSGTMVKQCTAHNVGIVINNGIGVGAKIRIIKSGKIIPKVIGVLQKADNIAYPSQCPSCGTNLTKVDNKNASELFCTNDNCPAKNIFSLTNYLEKMGIKGIGESKVKDLVECGLVKDFSDFYNLTWREIIDKSTLSERQATLIQAQIFMVNKPEQIKNNEELRAKIPNKVKIPIELFLSALGIPGGGKGTARNLVDAFNGDINAIRAATVSELSNINDIGEKTAQAIYEHLKDISNVIDKALEHIELDTPKQGKLTDYKFCFTGSFAEGKRHWQNIIEDAGGKVASSVSKTVDYVVIGADAGSKEKKARELNKKTGKPILIEDTSEILKLI